MLKRISLTLILVKSQQNRIEVVTRPASQQQGNSGTHFPCKVVLSSGRKYRYSYDTHSDLKKVTLAFSLQPGTKGMNRVTSKLPGLATPAVTYHTRDGLLAGRRQGNSITYVARFDGKGRPTSAASGDFVSQWHYGKAGLDTNSIFFCFFFCNHWFAWRANQ